MMKNESKSVEGQFICILKHLAMDAAPKIRELSAYKYVANWLSDEKKMLRFFEGNLNDAYHVKHLIAGKVILDAGCGSGIFSALLSLLGARKVYAVDSDPDCIEMTKYIVATAKINNIDVIKSDIAKLNLPHGTLEGVFSIESLSHVSDYAGFLRLMANLLERKGFFVIRDGNNGASPCIRRRNYRIWDVFENYTGAIKVFGHPKGEGCYLKEREDMIRGHFPTLDTPQVEKFAKLTFAYDEGEIVAACKQFIDGDFFLRSEYVYGKPPRDPKNGCYMERLLFPHDLKRELERVGFSCVIKSRGPSRRDLGVIRRVWEVLSPVSIFFPRPFRIIAVKNL